MARLEKEKEVGILLAANEHFHVIAAVHGSNEIETGFSDWKSWVQPTRGHAELLVEAIVLEMHDDLGLECQAVSLMPVQEPHWEAIFIEACEGPCSWDARATIERIEASKQLLEWSAALPLPSQCQGFPE